MQRTKISLAILGTAVLAGAAVYVAHLQKPNQSKVVAPHPTAGANTQRHPSLLPGVATTESAHYRIHSTATAQQTAQVTQAVEALYGHLPPRSYAYFDANARNPYHWMLHEATHQLMREASGFPRAKWVDEGVAGYFGASRLAGGMLRLGEPDPDAYPVWWLSNHALTGDLEHDIASGQVIPLEQLISGQGGPDENRYFNLYYIHYWSLTHFLFHYRDGQYAERYRQLISEGGTLENFTRLLGPPERIQQEWYDHLLRIVEQGDA